MTAFLIFLFIQILLSKLHKINKYVFNPRTTPSIVTMQGTNTPFFDNNVHTLWLFVVAEVDYVVGGF